MTLAAANLLSPVLDTHPPSAIITHAEFLSTLLELIYDAGEEGRHHTIVVVGEPSSRVMASVASKVKVLLWTDVEREGFKVPKIMTPLPSALRNKCSGYVFTYRYCLKNLRMFSASPSSRITQAMFKELK